MNIFYEDWDNYDYSDDFEDEMDKIEEKLDEQFEKWLKGDRKETPIMPKDKCVCSAETIVNSGCKCGYVERRRKKGLKI